MTSSAAMHVAEHAMLSRLAKPPNPEPTPEQVIARDCPPQGATPGRRAVEHVHGFLVRTEAGCGWRCKGALLTDKYRFVESEVGEAEALAARPLETDPPGTPPAGLVDRLGLYRFELKSSGSPGCETYERRPSSRPPGSACIAVTSIQKTTARFVSEGERHSRQYSWGYSWTQIDTVSEAIAAVIASNRRAHIKQTDGQKLPNGARDFYCPAVPELPLHLQIIPPAL